MKKSTLFLALILLASLVFLSSNVIAADPAPEEILVGVNTPLTGIFAGFGEGGTWGLKAAVEDLNKEGGVFVKEFDKKIPIKLVIVDNESNPGKSAVLEEDLILRKKVLFTCPPNQPLTLDIPQADMADKYKIPRISGGTPMEPWLSLRNDVDPPWQYSWTFGFAIVSKGPEGSYWAAPGYNIMDTWVEMLNKFGDQTNKKVAVFASDEPDGRGWYSLFPPALKKLGYDPVGIDDNLGLVPMDTTNFASLIKKWKDADVEILWGNSPSSFFATMWRQAQSMGFKPKMVSVGRAPLFYEEVNDWGGNLPQGVGVELWWHPDCQDCPGIGGTTGKSLVERWTKDTGRPLNPGIGWGYHQIQILADAIERAGTLDKEAVNKAIGETDMMTIANRVVFNEAHYNPKPLAYGQWQKVDKPWKWECETIFSQHDFVKPTAEPIFPVPYK